MTQTESSLCRVFLVDDDLLVLDDLRDLIDWEAEGFILTGTAGNEYDDLYSAGCRVTD